MKVVFSFLALVSGGLEPGPYLGPDWGALCCLSVAGTPSSQGPSSSPAAGEHFGSRVAFVPQPVPFAGSLAPLMPASLLLSGQAQQSHIPGCGPLRAGMWAQQLWRPGLGHLPVYWPQAPLLPIQTLL